MAVKPTKSKSKTRVKKKPVAKKRTPGRRKRKKQKKSNIKKNILVVLGVLFIISLVAFGYFLGNKNTVHAISQHRHISQHDHYHTKELLHDLSSINEIEPKKSNKAVKKKPLKEKTEKRVEKEKQQPQKRKVVTVPDVKKPKLAIVIDDVSNRSQIKRIQATGVKLTPSIFPPSELSMTSQKLAVPLDHYMIHLPMESGNAQFNTQYKTLLVKNSTDTIDQRVKEIRRLFPKAKYVNNHTGSVFTSDYEAMYTLYKALDEQGFVFIDSRTIASSKVKQIARQFGDRYISRDIFIDNEHNIPYIHQKLQEAVSIAKRNGYAIAIGHPHKVTIDALKQATEILNDVEVVYIDDLFKK